MFREQFEEPEQEKPLNPADAIIYGLIEQRDTLTKERDSYLEECRLVIEERDLFHKIAHDLYMAMARVSMPSKYRDTCIPAMNAYVEAFYGAPSH